MLYNKVNDIVNTFNESNVNFFLSKRRKLNSAVDVVTKYFYSITSFIIILNDAKSLFLNQKFFAISNRNFFSILRKSKLYARRLLLTLRQNSTLNFDVTLN